MARMTNNAETTTREATARTATAWNIPLLATLCILILASCGPAATSFRDGANQADSDLAAAPAVHGPAIDRIILERRTDPSQALTEVAAGRADLILDPLSPAAFRNISAADLEKLYLHPIPAESWSILINPIPNAAPYTWTTTSGQTSFNPLAIQELRYALNWLFDRQRMVDEILHGRGAAGFTPLPPGLTATTRFDAVPAGLGMSAAGDTDRAIREITSAMDAAAQLPENSGRLLKAADGFWHYDAKPVTIKFLIRADEPAGRLPAGRYLAAQLEKAGLKVQRLEQGRSALALAYFSNPADLAFHIYTEAWAQKNDSPSWDLLIGRQYAPGSGSLPGGADPAWWQYRNTRLDELTGSPSNSQAALELGLKEAVRIYLVFQHETVVANKASFAPPLSLDPGASFSGRSLRTARLAADRTGSGDGDGDGDANRVLRVLQLQARGILNLGSWDPASSEGFAEGYPKVIAELVSDAELVTDTKPASNAGKVARWHNGIEQGLDDIHYAALNGISFGFSQASSREASQGTSQTAGQDSGNTAMWSNHIILPWDLYEVLSQLAAESTSRSPQPNVQAGFDLVSPERVRAISTKYRHLLETQWVPTGMEDHTSPEQSAMRYRASMDFIDTYGHALISNGPFVLTSLESAPGTAILEAFQSYPYGSEYPIRTIQD